MAEESVKMDVEPEEKKEVEEVEGEKKAEKKVRFTVKKWNAAVTWSWAISADTCAICRNSLHMPSIE